MRVVRPRSVAGLALALALFFSFLAGWERPASASENLARGKVVTASGQETDWWGPDKLVDGDSGPDDATPPAVHNEQTASRWSANAGNHVWATVDLAAQVRPSQVRIRWGNTFSTNYSLLGSMNGVDWQPLVTKASGAKGEWVSHSLNNAPSVRYVKLESFAKSQQWSLSVWELEVYGEVEQTLDPDFATAITPKPAKQQPGESGDFSLTADTVFVATGEAAKVAERFAADLRTSTGYALPVRESGEGVRWLIDDSVTNPEGYTLNSGQDGVTITASTTAGLGYGGESLMQLLGVWSRSSEPVVQDWVVPGVAIEDSPRYAWRGFMLDVSRNFFTVDEVRQAIDQMAQYKLNVLHMHLSDDQGWRIAISNEGKAEGDPIDYTKLTSVSGATAMAPTDWTTRKGTAGYYSADDFRDILAYAADRGIAVVPEIDVPGHTNAILHAIPQMNTDGSLPKLKDGETTVPPQTTGAVGNSALDANAEITYQFIKHVVGQLLEEYPSTVRGEQFFHIGGDETHKMNEVNPNNYKTFMGRATGIVKDLGATGIVWNEAAASAADSMADGMAIQTWSSLNGVKDYVEKHDGRVIMSLAANAYLPQVPGDLLGPNWACGGPCDLHSFYEWNPTTRVGVAEDRVLGVEAALWGEHLRSWKSAEYLIQPRLAATAEVGWTPQDQRSYQEFRQRVADLGNSLTIQDRNFYPEDGEWEPTARALAKDPVAEGTAPGDIAVASIPEVKVADVSAKATLSVDQGTPVSTKVNVKAERDFLPGAKQLWDNRSAASLMRFSIDSALPAGAYTGTLTITYPDGTLDVPLAIVVGSESQPSPELTPTPSPAGTPKPTQSPEPAGDLDSTPHPESTRNGEQGGNPSTSATPLALPRTGC
ncbi:family 20 glycosylhydrolase [Cutibacterium sp.]|uniref:family 20 glycosylhydrolase n=1 Tax=Cutibacterium sp. TaxID=1912221 RepID=UPI0026DDA5A3|nr:family 20 glycosylhydrolase [Cutibacterium sp.]MDO4412346.1 family 20 glycosylhydrolase [Cutibacterium sp.]